MRDHIISPGPAFLREPLFFGTTNAKLIDQKTATFALPAGYTCPGAKDCHSWYDREEGKLFDGKDQKFRCYAAGLEARYSNVRASVDNNLRRLKEAKTAENMAALIDFSLPARRFENIRVHANGDFYSGDYFIAWMEAARRNPERVFYAYTKSLPTWVRLRKLVPTNFVLTASYGGKFDALIAKHNLRSAKVVMHPDEAEALGLKIDKTDGLARDPDHGDFALLIHGMGPAGSDHNEAIKVLNKADIHYSYPRKPTK